MKLFLVLYSLLTSFPFEAYAFVPRKCRDGRLLQQIGGALSASRRDFVEVLTQSAVVGALASVGAAPAEASGGATAGGAYLLSAKQRYNERVKEGVKGYLGIQAAIEAGNIDAIRVYFTGEDTGSWKDLTSAGYLLANAFRRNSTTPPDSLPAVKAWKKFAGSVEGIAKALKKKDVKGALATYNESLALLDDYLKEVELPAAKELSVA